MEQYKLIFSADKGLIAEKIAYFTRFLEVTPNRLYRSDTAVLKPEHKWTFDELCEQYIADHLPTIKVETQRRYLVDIALRIKPNFQHRDLASIDSTLIERFRSRLLSDGLSKKSINNCMSTLRHMLKKAVKWKMLDKSPYDLDDLKVPEQKYSWWDKEEYIHRFLDEARHTPYYGAYRLALDCGLRLGEIVGLSKGDIDLVRCTIHIHRQWLDKERCYGPPKNNRERFVNFDPDSDLKAILASVIKSSPHSEALFVSRTGARQGSRKISGYFFNNCVQKAGVPKICFHDLRHTFASWYMIEVGDIWSLKAILGYQNVTTTERYAHISNRHQRVASFQWKNAPTLNPLSQSHLKIISI